VPGRGQREKDGSWALLQKGRIQVQGNVNVTHRKRGGTTQRSNGSRVIGHCVRKKKKRTKP